MSRSLKPAYIEKIDQLGDLQVWVVDGTFIRSHHEAELTQPLYQIVKLIRPRADQLVFPLLTTGHTIHLFVQGIKLFIVSCSGNLRLGKNGIDRGLSIA